MHVHTPYVLARASFFRHSRVGCPRRRPETVYTRARAELNGRRRRRDRPRRAILAVA